MTLTGINKGTVVRVLQIRHDKETSQRLAELGLHLGSLVQVLSRAGQDPLLLDVKGARLALSRHLADGLVVRALGEDPTTQGKRRRLRRRRAQGA